MTKTHIEMSYVIYKKQACGYLPQSSHQLKYLKSSCGWDQGRGLSSNLGEMSTEECLENCISQTSSVCKNYEVTKEGACILWSGVCTYLEGDSKIYEVIDETIFGDGSNYRGLQNQTMSGKRCQEWDS